MDSWTPWMLKNFHSLSWSAVPLKTAWHEGESADKHQPSYSHSFFSFATDTLRIGQIFQHRQSQHSFSQIVLMSLPVLLHKQLPASPRADCPRVHRDLKEPLFVRNLTFFCSFKISSNIMPCSCWVMSTWHALLYTKPNLSVWWFSMPKGFRIGQHIRQIPGMSKLKGTFGHTVWLALIQHLTHDFLWLNVDSWLNFQNLLKMQ